MKWENNFFLKKGLCKDLYNYMKIPDAYARKSKLKYESACGRGLKIVEVNFTF